MSSWAAGRLDVFVVGTSGALWHKLINPVGSTWESPGGVCTASPAAVSWVANYDRMDVFVRGTDGALWHKWYQNGWSGWYSLGGQLTASPTAATYTYNGTIDIEVFVRGSNGLIYLKEYYDGGWWGWQGPY